MRRAFLAALVLLAALPAGSARAAARQDFTAGPWRFAVGDDLTRAAPSFDDSSWRSISVTKGWEAQGVGRMGFAWYRATVHPSAAVRSSPMTTLHLEPADNTAVWVYVDGVLKGTSQANPASIVLSPADLPDHDLVVAVRAYCGATETLVGYNPCGLAGRVRFEPSATTPAAMPFSLSTNRLGNLAEPGGTMSIYGDVLNSTTATRTLTLRFATGGAPFDDTATLAPGERHRFTAPFSSDVRGPVALSATVFEKGKALATRSMAIGVADAPAAPDQRFGLNTLESVRIAVALGTEGLPDPAFARRAGASWIRAHLTPWKDVSAEPGRRDWDLMDAFRAASTTAGTSVVWNMLGVPYWALDYPFPNFVQGLQSDLWCPPKPSFFGEFAQFHADAAARYPGDAWEIGNEPELPTNNYCWRFPEFLFNDAGGYVALLLKTYDAVHDSDPTARVLTAALATTPTPLGDPAFASKVMNDGSFDVFNVHIYSDQGTLTDSDGYNLAADARTMLEKRGLTNEVWGTEYGGNSAGSPVKQRLATTRLALQLLAGGASRVAFFYDVEYPGEPLPGTSLFDAAGGPRPALFGYLTMTRMLAGLPLDGVVDIDGVPAVRFSDGSRTVTAIWDDKGRPVSIPAGAEVFDDFGNHVAQSGTVALESTPIWIVQS